MVGARVRRQQVAYARSRGLSGRRACALLSVARSTIGYVSRLIARDAPIVPPMRTLAAQYPRYGYRTIRIFLERQGHTVGTDRMYRLWRQAQLQVPKKRPRRRVATSRPRPLPPTAVHHVWAYDFVFDTCADGRALKCLTVIDEFTRECLAIDVAGGIRSGRVIEVLAQLVSTHGAPRYLRSDNGLPQKSRRQSFADLTTRSVESDVRRQAVSTVAEGHADHSHTRSGDERPALTRLHKALHSRWKVRALSTRSLAPQRPWAKGSSRLVSSLPGSDESRCRW
jgi:putative transposase